VITIHINSNAYVNHGATSIAVWLSESNTQQCYTTSCTWVL